MAVNQALKILAESHLQLPLKGNFEFKHFFTTKVGVNKGEGQSARAVQAQIRKMIELEPHSKPVSDSILSKMLADKGMSIARRTVSKVPRTNEHSSGKPAKISALTARPIHLHRADPCLLQTVF